MQSSEKILGDSAFLERVKTLLTTDSQLTGMFPDKDVYVACNRDGLATVESVDGLAGDSLRIFPSRYEAIEIVR